MADPRGTVCPREPLGRGGLTNPSHRYPLPKSRWRLVLPALVHVAGAFGAPLGCRRKNIAVQKGDFEEANVMLRVYN